MKSKTTEIQKLKKLLNDLYFNQTNSSVKVKIERIKKIYKQIKKEIYKKEKCVIEPSSKNEPKYVKQARQRGCNPEYSKGIFGMAWRCTCSDMRHAINSQCSDLR